MNWKNLLLAAFGLAAAGMLASCTGFETASSGEVIRNPSVEEMDRLHDQWGMPRRQVKPRYRAAMPSDFMNESSTSSTSASDSIPLQTQTPPSGQAPALQEPPPEPIPSPVPDAPAPPATAPTPIPDNLR